MSDVSSLINLGDISKPATVLIEKISEAVGGLFKPHQIKRVTKAEAEAEIIRAQTRIEITELERRALTRFVAEEATKQKNMEDITEKAIPELNESSNPENVEDDWLTNFFDKCRIVSDDQMQSLWAKVLAGEANSPGTYSKRTVNFLGSLDKADAELFSSICGFGWLVSGIVPLIYDPQAEIYTERGVNFSALTHLDAIGLIKFQPVTNYTRLKIPRLFPVIYYGNLFMIEFANDENNVLNIGNVLLTRIGEQLAPICGSKEVDGFDDYVVSKWRNEGMVIYSPYPKVLISDRIDCR